MPGPLAGVKVFEVSQIVAGPYAGQTLADLGADVVKCEPPGGEGLRVLGEFVPGESKAFHTLNRGKRSLVLDLGNAAGQAAVHRLIPDFDVFLINSRPGVPQRLNVDYDSLTRFRPDLVYIENSGYGDRGPGASRSGSDIIAQAYSGLMAADGKVDEYGAPEMITATAPGDYHAGLGAALGVVAALFHRERTGEGQHIASSLLAAGLNLAGGTVSKLPVFDAMVTDPAMQRLREAREAGASYQEQLAAKGSLFDMMGKAFRLYYGGYSVKDGAVILGALTPANRDQFRRALGVEDDPTASPDFNALDPANNVIAEGDAGARPCRHAHEDDGRVDRGVRRGRRPRLEGEPPRGDGRRPAGPGHGLHGGPGPRVDRAGAHGRPDHPDVEDADGQQPAVADPRPAHRRDPARARLERRRDRGAAHGGRHGLAAHATNARRST